VWVGGLLCGKGRLVQVCAAPDNTPACLERQLLALRRTT
jgi:hypothetical protein